jgi:hypothetical protein
VKTSQIIDVLGKSFGDPAVQALVRELGIKKAPKAKPDEPEDQLQAKPLGVELSFTDGDYLAKRKVARYGNADMILTGATLYAAGGEPGFKGFAESLPKGTSLSDSPDQLIAKLGPPAKKDEEDERIYSQAWKMGNYWMTFSYGEHNQPKSVQIILPAYLERFTGSAS